MPPKQLTEAQKGSEEKGGGEEARSSVNRSGAKLRDEKLPRMRLREKQEC